MFYAVEKMKVDKKIKEAEWVSQFTLTKQQLNKLIWEKLQRGIRDVRSEKKAGDCPRVIVDCKV